MHCPSCGETPCNATYHAASDAWYAATLAVEKAEEEASRLRDLANKARLRFFAVAGLEDD